MSSSTSYRSSRSGGSSSYTSTYQGDQGEPLMNSVDDVVHNVEKLFYQRAVWILILVAVILSIVVYLIARNKFHDVHHWARLPSWMTNPVLMFLFFLVAVLLAALATGRLYSSSPTESRWKYVAMLMFFGVGGILALMAYLVYQAHNFMLAFYLSLVLLVLGLVHLYSIYVLSGRALGSPYVLQCLPLVALVGTSIFVLWYMADESSSSIATVTPVHP